MSGKKIRAITALLLTGIFFTPLCRGSVFVRRKDRIRYVEFPKAVKKDSPEIYRLYRPEYPRDIAAKDRFLKELGVLGARLLLGKKSLNLILPAAFLTDLAQIRRGEPFPEEEIYARYASELDEGEKQAIAAAFPVAWPEEFGELQGIVNKQYYYWLRYAGREKEYDPEANYTEFDKRELFTEILENRKQAIETLPEILADLVIEADGAAEEIIAAEKYPLYIAEKAYARIAEESEATLLIFRKGDPERLYEGKITLTAEKESATLRHYKIIPAIQAIKTLKEIKNGETSGIRTRDLRAFTLREESASEKRGVTVRKQDTPRAIPAFNEKDPEWVIE